MQRIVWLAAAALGASASLAACGTGIDDRPLTLPFIAETILAPSCGAAECHSTMVQSYGYVFDTVEGARESMVNSGGGLASVDDTDPADSALIGYITGTLTPRMPYDAPFPDANLALLKRWVEAGVPGAQCDTVGAPVCSATDKTVYTCDDDFNFGDIVTVCTATQKCLVDHCVDVSQ